MGPVERRSSRAGQEEIDQSTPSDRHDSDITGTSRLPPQAAAVERFDLGSSRSGESGESFSHRASKQPTPKTDDLYSLHRLPSHHGFPFLPHSSNTSRASSAKTSSSSLQALNEDAVTNARSEHGLLTRSSLARRLSQHFEQPAEPLAPTIQPVNTSADFPVYPDQSYAVLQSQVYPPPYQPFLRSRSSYPSHADYARQREHPQPQGPRTAGNTPISSPGLFSVRSPQTTPSIPSDEEARVGSPFLHPTHLQPPKETYTAEVDRDLNTGNKIINDYEILEELGRGEHGKVKLGRHLPTKQQVAIKIVQRYSKRRRLGKLGDPEDKVKKEVAILKKARHPNVVSLLEVIDDPNRQKVYIVLEYVENGEIKWRKKGLKEIVYVDKLRIEREKNGIPDSPSFVEEHHQYVKRVQHHRRLRERAREKRQTQLQGQQPWAWSLEHGGESDDELGPELSVIRTISRNIQENPDAPSPSQSYNSSTSEFERRMRESTLAAVEGSMYGPYVSDYPSERRFSATSSILGYASSETDWFSDDDDMSYVPCLTIAEARCAFRDAVLGLEYLHYQGIIHRDIKPANLLVTSNYRVKISDFGVSYLGRPIRDDDEEQVAETDATELDDARGELSKTVGTPAFYAPELCYTDDDFVDAQGRAPKITGAIDIWSLGVTLYGMIFGRLPFVSDDKFSLFQTIGKKEVFIPSKRLKPVEADVPSHPSEQRNYVMNSNKRLDDELVYEDIDDTLRELLQRLLTKDPNKRITIKEIKHHPWVLQGLPNPLAWVEETDPGYQSKGKRIEVSNEEVTSAVSKVPFVDRFRSGVAKLSGLIVGRKDSRRRTPSAAGSTDRAASSKDVREGRRASLRGDEEVFRPAKLPRESDHPLSHSVTASPDNASGDESRFDPHPSKCEATLTADHTPRPHGPERAASATSTADSTKTVRPLTLSMHPIDTSSSSNLGGLFSGAGHGLARRFQNAERRSRSVDNASVEGDVHSEPSLALSVASATGQVQSPGPRRDEGYSQAGQESKHPDCSSGSGHRRHRSCQLPHDSSAESFPLAKEMLLRQTTLEKEPIADDDRPPSRVESETYSNDCPPFEREAAHEDLEWESSDKGGLTTSPPSAATISSSSVDEYTSGMSQSASHPSIPSVLSGASSLSGDGFHVYLKEREKESEQPSYVPAILRTGDTITAENFPYHRLQEDEEYRYDCDDEDGESEDEGIVLGQKKQPRGEGSIP